MFLSAAFAGFKLLVQVLLSKNANCNLVTQPPPPSSKAMKRPSQEDAHFKEEDQDDEDFPSDSPEAIAHRNAQHSSRLHATTYSQTPLHLAILGGHCDIIQEILSYHEDAQRKGNLDSTLLKPDLSIRNSRHQTPLALSIELKQPSIAQMLISAGADVDVRDDVDGRTLLHKAIMSGDAQSAHFLLEHGADATLKLPPSGQSYLHLAVQHSLPTVVRELCSLDASLRSGKTSSADDSLPLGGDCILWDALKIFKETGSDEIASILVEHGCDVNYWHVCPEGRFKQTLLLRALDENNEGAAVFLVRAGCDIHACRLAGNDGDGSDDCDGQTPVSCLRTNRFNSVDNLLFFPSSFTLRATGTW